MQKKLTCLTSGHSTCCFKLSRSSDSAPFRTSAPLNCRFSVSSSLTRVSAFSHFCFVKSTLNSICFSFCKALFSSSCVTARVLCELYRFSMSRISCLISSTFLLATSSRCSRTSFSLFNSVHCDSSSETWWDNAIPVLLSVGPYRSSTMEVHTSLRRTLRDGPTSNNYETIVSHLFSSVLPNTVTNMPHLFLSFAQVSFQFLSLVSLYTDCLASFSLHFFNYSLLIHSTVSVPKQRVPQVLQLFREGAVLFPVHKSMRMLLMITVFHLLWFIFLSS